MPDNLALRMRPKTIDQVIGQEHLVGPGKIIRRMVEANRLSSMILYGPPGIGKTSIASAIAGTTKYAFRTFNATVDSKKRLQEIAEEAKFSGGLVLLLDEIHRLDKTKQDFLLPLLEILSSNLYRVIICLSIIAISLYHGYFLTMKLGRKNPV